MRAQIYVYRHQHAGFDLSCAFAKRPTEEELSQETAELAARHRAGWVKIEAVPIEVGMPDRRVGEAFDEAPEAGAVESTSAPGEIARVQVSGQMTIRDARGGA